MANHNPPSKPLLKGNNFQSLAIQPGRKRLFENPHQLWLAACSYFIFCTDTLIPVWEYDYGKLVKVYKVQAMSSRGLCLFLGQGKNTLTNYRKDPLFIDTVHRITDVMFVHNFKHAAIGVLNGRVVFQDQVYT